MGMTSVRFVTVDVETTGVYNSDRVVEVAAVSVSGDGQILDEWDTLVNPLRDVGPVDIHGITASMVSAAPRFEEVAAGLAQRIDGAILVAHNLPFDARMLMNEYERLDAKLHPGDGVCTLSLCGERLDVACARHGIELGHHHRALADARATAKILAKYLRGLNGQTPAAVDGLVHAAVPRTLRREVVGEDLPPLPFLARLTFETRLHAERGATLLYLDMLDWAIADLELSGNERQQLGELALDLGMTQEGVHDAHRRYFAELVFAAARDGIITDTEYRLLEQVAEALGIDPSELEGATCAWRNSCETVRLSSGMTVCFTGQATYSDGTEMPRQLLCQLAEDMELAPVPSVTKSRCNLVVAADASSLSGKAEKARRYGIPIVDLRDFLMARVGFEIPARWSSPSPRRPSKT